MNINPQIRSVCDAAFAGSNPNDPRCVRAARSGRYFDAAFVAAGMPANRLEQINMIGTTNSSTFDSLTTTVKHRRTMGHDVVQVRPGELALVGRPAGGLLQRQRDRRRPPSSSSPNPNGGRRGSTSGTASWRARRSTCPTRSSSRRSSSGRRRGRTRRTRASTPTATDSMSILDRLCEGVDPRGGLRRPRQYVRDCGAQSERLPARAGEQRAIGTRREPGRNDRRAQRAVLQRGSARHQVLHGAVPRP